VKPDGLVARLLARVGGPKLVELVTVGGRCVDEARWAALAWIHVCERALDEGELAELDRLAAKLGRESSTELATRQPADLREMVSRLTGALDDDELAERAARQRGAS